VQTLSALTLSSCLPAVAGQPEQALFRAGIMPQSAYLGKQILKRTLPRIPHKDAAAEEN